MRKGVGMKERRFPDHVREYHFQLKHLTVIFAVVFGFQLIVSVINKSSMRSLFNTTQEWYQKDSAERTANLTTTSFELLLESVGRGEMNSEEARRLISAFNILFTQQALQHNTQEICVILKKNGKLFAVDDGELLYRILFSDTQNVIVNSSAHHDALTLYCKLNSQLATQQQIVSMIESGRIFKTFVPIIIRGEYVGALFVSERPTFSIITSEVASNYDELSLIYLSLITLGLLSMYFISSYTVRERDQALSTLFAERENNLKKQITHEKEVAFTRRIYHTYHKAEKIVGFIRSDLSALRPDNIETIKYRLSKYANFISRIIYDMKWYDPPIQTIRSPIFYTNINEVIRFSIDNIFLRSFRKSGSFNVNFIEDRNLP
ncbi:MAG: histidine kinase, partial [Candidatus Kryptoniota bacterium]